MRIGLIGLGKMGMNLALNLKEHGHEVVAYARSKETVDKAMEHGLIGVYGISELLASLSGRKVVWLMVPAGDTVDDMLDQIIPGLVSGDIIIDGGNSKYTDTLRRADRLAQLGLEYVDIGTSGGMEGARNGICAMIGAKDEVFSHLEPMLASISVQDGYLHTGRIGSGHYTKMIHNGIEYGMMQSIGEGFEILKEGPFELDYEKVAKVWNHGSVIRGWLMELAQSMFSKDPELDRINGVVNHSGEGLWTAEEALRLGVPSYVIVLSLMDRFRSQKEETFTDKVCAGLRNEFGGHALVEKK